MRPWLAFGTMLLAALPFSAASGADCMKGLKPALVSGGFSGSVDCRHDRLSVKYVGQVRSFGRTFEIYSNRYALRPACPDCAVHGGQRIIVMNRGHYLGQYRSEFVHALVRRGRLLLVPGDPGSGRPTIVKFTRAGPPRQVRTDGEVVTFFK